MQINLNEFKTDKLNRVTLLNPKTSEVEWYKKFKIYFEKVNGRPFIATEESKKLVYTLIYYFTKKDNFYKSPLLYNHMNTNYSLEKGLIIVGGFGCGKSSILKTFQYMINENPKINLKFMTTIEAVKEYEITEQENLFNFNNKLIKGHLIIDDLLAEKEASRFGKTELFETVLFQRCGNSKMTTLITMNYDSEIPNDIEFALNKLSRYGGRVYDRILGNFNFIELQGKSFRI